MFVMLSVRTTTVCERQAETGKEKVIHLDNIYINNNNIEKTFTKSISFDKNINKSNLLLTELNNFKQPPALQVIKHKCNVYICFVYIMCRGWCLRWGLQWE